MSAIRRMMGQANPQADVEPEAPATSAPRRALNLPPVPAPEERKAFSTRVKPSLKRVLEEYVKEIQGAGFSATQEQVLDVLLRELRDNDALRDRVAEVLVREAG